MTEIQESTSLLLLLVVCRTPAKIYDCEAQWQTAPFDQGLPPTVKKIVIRVPN
jgi:hypothetical protein